MKFMLLMSAPRDFEKHLAAWSPADFQAHVAYMLRLNEQLRQNGELLLAEGLDMPTAARLVRWQPQGPPLVTDGPFVETKEFLAGFWIVEVPSRERAIAIAGLASMAPGPGGAPLCIPIELRQVMSAPTCDA